MLGSGSFLDGYEVGSKRPRMIESDPYFAVSGGPASYLPSYGGTAVPASVPAASFPAVKLRGLPFDCSDFDVRQFLSSLDIVDCLLTQKFGRFSGDAYVVFASPRHAELALQRDRLTMGHRYVEVFHCKKQDYYAAICAEVSGEGQRSLPEAKAGVLKLRGLPFSASCVDIAKLFEEFHVLPKHVHVAYRADGRTTGEAYVEFSSPAVAAAAMAAKNRTTVGSRYIEIFPSSLHDLGRTSRR